MAERKASRTAVLVCQGRAVADGRMAVGRFSDPVAVELLTAPERVLVEQVRSGVAPQVFGDRIEYGLLSGVSETLATRTVTIDDALRDRGNTQLVILGAGLDARAWRMKELADATVFEVDQPASQQDKRQRLGERTLLAGSVRFVPVDFATDSLDAALAAAGHDTTRATTWIWEGVVNYLTREQIAATAAVVAARSAPGSRFIITYPAPSVRNTLGRRIVRPLWALARRQNPIADEPMRSTWTPERMRELLDANGFEVVTDIDQLTVAQELDLAVERGPFLRSGRIVVADRI
ncbi:class I SAM-dependent methyltransferase [Nocardia sp. NBC_01503]|uniref:class I SAM-dependent methyltransferase n=1 Tax=Nocardia sp. NBC_01503 TaxID=2975997 RepID=UPI002E7AF67D|nr:class I SAM-dependent methyltransferase [Nocardia sp. NBC_01503]WTL30527.1 class I SAM-dependent methyltransferase [Nocardia sp. NBC_01503]